MSELRQIESDLGFIRTAVERRRGWPAPRAILVVWAVYVLVGYTMLDFDQRAGGLFLMIGGVAGGLLSWWIGARAGRRAGEMDAATGRSDALHWIGLFIGVIAVLVLMAFHEPLQTNLGGQMIVIVVGLTYFLYGVHRDRHFLYVGLVVMCGAVAVSFIPRYPWTALGVVFAAGLLAPLVFGGRGTDVTQIASGDVGDVEAH